MRKAILIVLITFSVILTGCKNEPVERKVEDNEMLYDFIGTKSIKVNDEVFTLFCRENKNGDLWVSYTMARNYVDDNDKKYISLFSGACSVYYDQTMYHGFDLLENGKLTVEELDLLGFPFELRDD